MCVRSIGSKISSVITFIISVLFLTSHVDAARIFALFPWPAYSHQVLNHQLSMGLAKRGHELTVFTTNPMNLHIPNYTEHSLSHIYPIVRTNLNYIDRGKEGLVHHFKSFVKVTEMMADTVYSNTDLKDYVSPNSTKKFDLVIIASVYVDSLYYISHLLNAPLIVTVTTPGFAFNYFEIGNPTVPACFPDVNLGYSDHMDFRQRLENLLHIIRQWYDYHYVSGPAHGRVLRKHFGDVPSIEDVRRRISMMFLNTHPHLHYPRPMPPNILQIGGLRMGLMNKTLPEEIKSILDDAKQGFIYFSLGSSVNSSQLRSEILENIIGAFSELPYLIVWKFDSDLPLHQPSNVLIWKWIPQHGVLAHPNIKLFIYQGGLQSTEEAIECGVPLLGIPIILDQYFNMEALKRKGIAESLDLYTMTKGEIKDKIYKVISNPKYKENMEKLGTILRDRPRHPLDEAIWWSEYVIRHKGAPYFQSPRLPWYQHHMIDIYALFIVGLLVLCYLLWKAIQFIIIRPQTHVGSIHKKVLTNSLKWEKVKNS
ncbi:UDP-glucuronosyltransferase 2B31 [Diachasma alloeum]|uniref:UDP-glucuronosyltransferase 2B31 n=1 Tax=Diachasma alloeum TaxID=454923 RepID=UPI0007381C2C|nr:UDP-glucuronosyltransferase 2B31 [Diachasma alloeum]